MAMLPPAGVVEFEQSVEDAALPGAQVDEVAGQLAACMAHKLLDEVADLDAERRDGVSRHGGR